MAAKSVKQSCKVLYYNTLQHIDNCQEMAALIFRKHSFVRKAEQNYSLNLSSINKVY